MFGRFEGAAPLKIHARSTDMYMKREADRSNPSGCRMPRSVKGDILYPFATLSFIVVVLLGVSLGLAIGRDIETRMTANAAGTAADATIPALQSSINGLDLQAPLADASYHQLQQVVSQNILSNETLRLRIYNSDGVTVYSSDPSEVGRVLADKQALTNALNEKTTGTATSGNFGDSGVRLLQVYTPLHEPDNGQVTAALEIDRYYAVTAAGIAAAQRNLFTILGIGLLSLYAALQLGVWGATRALAKDHSRLTYLYQTGEHVRSSLDMQEVLTQIVRDSALVVQGHCSLICLADQEARTLMARAAYDRHKDSVALHRREVTEWLFHRVLATGETSIVGHWHAEYRRVFGIEIEQTPMAVLCVPMTLRHKVTGVIAVLRHASNEGFSRAEAKMLEEIAAQAAMAVEQANLFARVRAYASELELSYDATLKALSAALDAKDAVTEGHSERVANLTLAIAREMRVPKEKMVDIERGALLHDVGKIGVPDAVLRKPAALSRREWQAMRQHPLLAGILVSKVGFLEGALPILLYHHERYDGKGYPFGLAGDHIPLEARIFAVVDAYDAMTSDRPYRKATGREAAVREIVKNSGSQFDSSVVDAFLRVVDEFPVPLRGRDLPTAISENDEDAA